MPSSLAVYALGCVGIEPSAALRERARVDARLLYEGDEIDIWEYHRRLEKISDGGKNSSPNGK
jgi:hypothetical protein